MVLAKKKKKTKKKNKNRYTDQWNRNSPEINQHTYGQLVYTTKGNKNIMEKRQSFLFSPRGTGKIRQLHVEE